MTQLYQKVAIVKRRVKVAGRYKWLVTANGIEMGTYLSKARAEHERKTLQDVYDARCDVLHAKHMMGIKK